LGALIKQQSDVPALAARLNSRLPFFYGWVIVGICLLCVLMNGATTFWAVPVFIGPMAEDTGWSNGAIFAALSIRFIVSATGGLFVGRFADARGGAARLMLIGVLIDAGSLLTLRWADSPLTFILLYGVVGGLGGTSVRLVQSTLIPKWFVARRGVAVGFASNGGGLSAIIMAPITALLISEFGWRDAWGVLGIIMIVLLLPLVPFAVRSPEDLGLQPDNGATVRRSVRSAATERSFTLAEVVHTWQFWLLLTGVLIGNFSLQTHTVVMVPHAEDLGFSSERAATALSMYGLFSLAMRFVWGSMADRFTVRVAIIMQSLLTGLAVFLLMQITGLASLYVIMAFQGMTLSGYPPLQTLVWPEFFGRMHIGSIVGVTQFFTTVVAGAGPVIVGVLYDQTGSHTTSLWLLVATWMASAAVMLIVRPAQRSEAAVPSRSSAPAVRTDPG
jgi:MFS family permease